MRKVFRLNEIKGIVMKKFISLMFILLLLCSCLTGCFVITKEVDVKDKKTEPSFENAITEEEIKALLSENAYCNINLFTVSSLWPKGDALKDHIYEADTEKFADYKAFKKYLSNIYTADYVKYLLNDYPEKGNPLYVNIDGKLCINANLMAGRGYDVNWDNPKITIKEQTETESTFEATVSKTESGKNTKSEDYTVTVTAVYENGKWLLPEIIS